MNLEVIFLLSPISTHYFKGRSLRDSSAAERHYILFRLVRRGAYAKRATRLRQGDELPLFANYTLQNGLFVKNLQIYLHIPKKCCNFVLDFKTSGIV